MNNTGVPHSISSLRSANIASRAPATLASTARAGGELLIERACKYNRRFVTDLELHGDYRRNVALNQAIRPRPRTGPLRGDARAVTGVENCDAQGAELVQNDAEFGAVHWPCPAAAVLEQKNASPCVALVRSVTDVMQGVECLCL